MSNRTHAVLLVALALATYATGIVGEFVLDDRLIILTGSGIGDLWSFEDYPNRPVLLFTLSLNYALSGPEPAAFRLTNILIHACAALVLYGVVRRTLSLPRMGEVPPATARGLAFAVAALWMVHPINTHAVTYVWQRGESMMGLFFLGAIYATLRSAEGPRKGLWTGVAIVSCLLGFGTKETMVAVIPVLLLYDWILISGSLPAALRARWPIYAMFAAIVAVGALVVLPNTSTTRGSFSTWEYASSQPGVVLDYLRLSVAPYPLCFDWGIQPPESLLGVIPAAIVIFGLLALTVRQLLRRSWQGVGGAWFFLVLAPTSSFIAINDLMVEYRMYLPLVAVIAFAVAGGRALCARVGAPPKVVLAVALLVYGSLTALRNLDYRSEIDLWQSSIAVSPNNPRAHNSLVRPYLDAGEKELALHHAQTAFSIKEGFLTRWKLAQALDVNGKLDEALMHAEECAKIRNRDAKVQQQIGRLYLKKRQVGKGMEAYKRSVQLAPKNPSMRIEYAERCAAFNRMDEAEEQIRAALRLDPSRVGQLVASVMNGVTDRQSSNKRQLGLRIALLTVKATGGREADPLVALGRAYMALGKPREARVAFAEALRLPAVRANLSLKKQLERTMSKLPR